MSFKYFTKDIRMTASALRAGKQEYFERGNSFVKLFSSDGVYVVVVRIHGVQSSVEYNKINEARKGFQLAFKYIYLAA